MKADAKKLLNEFIASTQGVQYVIPVYQRNYTWSKYFVNRLLSDIVKLLEKKSDSHFLGNLIYVRTKKDFMKQEWSIVDGQQRLTTMFLILFAIRDVLFSKNENDEAKQLVSVYLENVNAKDDNYKLRLKPLVSNDEEFKKIALPEAKNEPDNSTLIRKNYNLITPVVKKWFDIYSLDEIISALNKLYIVYIELETTDNAQQIFESINSGEPLKKSDLIRNFILMNKDDNTQTKLYKNYWKEIEKNIADDSKRLEAFFRFYLATKNFVLNSINDLYTNFISYWDKEKIRKTDEEVLSDILKFAGFYNKLFVKSNSIKKEIDTLRKIQSDMPTPLLFGLTELHYNDKITERQYLDCMQTINSYIIRRHMCNLDTSAISRFFPSVLKEILTICKKNFENICDVLKYCLENQTRQKSSYLPSDDEIRTILTKSNAYILQHTRTFFEIVEDENNIKIDKSNLTIEHIMPQTATDYWTKSANTQSEEEYAKLVNLIGNLTFADKSTNSSISNDTFELKKKRLGEVGKIDLSKDIFDKEKWGKDEINERTNVLINKFVTTFPFFTSKTDYEKETAFLISYNSSGVVGNGKIYNKSKVIIDIDSEVRITDNRNTIDDNIISEMLENNELEQLSDKYILKKEMVFTSPSDAATFIIGGSHNGWEFFKDEDGKAINISVRKHFDNNSN